MTSSKYQSIISKLKNVTKTYGILFFCGCLLLVGMKLFYSRSDSSSLDWILAPTAWWVRTLSGIPFENEPHVGYVNHGLRFVIARSCCGMQFMMIAFAMLFFSFLHRMKTRGKAVMWGLLSFTGSYFYTIFINGIRIVLSIYLPAHYAKRIGFGEWMSAERLHTVLGTVLYFSALLALYRIAELLSCRINAANVQTGGQTKAPGSKTARRLLSPASWYFFILLGIPFLNHASRGNPEGFLEYAAITIGISFGITGLVLLAHTFFHHKHNR